MTAPHRIDRELLVLIAALMLLAAWVASVPIRLVEHVPVEVVPEMGGAAIAVSLLTDRLRGRRRNGGDES